MKEDEADIFRELMQDVTPLKQEPVANTRYGVEKSETHAARRAAATAIEKKDPGEGLSDQVHEWVEPDGIIEWRRPGVQDGVFRQLKRGKYPVDADLDLHRMRAKQARSEVARFIADCYRRGIRTCRIVHGTGKYSAEQPALLKSLCNQWLKDLDHVLAFHTAQRQHGGYGATYVMIQKNMLSKLENREQNRKR
ncbi:MULTISPECIES: DNA endonuclease SmrA [Gammaproteobacteria]|uniref:DNA endonuclease SmrA n=1 Tax=Gammaproteobacteria TaxID=1236 RepID=UPI000DD0E0C6|nr:MULTISPECIES: DNA endonuclease SmrA [Gammaproteobacteria]RTE86181.1 DNA endonuclease SmrA [Aliidiomarina sp. B3213]TCZ91533.1 DNA endonuclease SmrA [Lysobacter sp. N42]